MSQHGLHRRRRRWEIFLVFAVPGHRVTEESTMGDSKEFIIALMKAPPTPKRWCWIAGAKLSSNSRSRWRSKRRATAGWSIGRALVTASLTVIASAVAHARKTSPRWLSATSGKPPSAGIATAANRLTRPLPGNAPAAPRSATRCVTIVRNSTLSVPPACQSPRCSRPPKCAGCWMRLSMATCAPNAVRFASAPSTAGCCGI